MIVRSLSLGILALTIAGVGAACGGATPEPIGPTTPTASASASGSAPVTPSTATAPTTSGSAAVAPIPTGPFKDMNRDQRLTYMAKVVMPKMTAAFQKQDPDRYKEFTCVACHGAGAKTGNFTMPSKDLPKLTVANGFKKHKDATPEMMKFMAETVVPEMATLLDMPKYNPATHQGFGCFACHMAEK